MSTLFALFVGCVAVPVAADATARAHCSHWWCCSSTCCCCWCCGLPYAQLFYLLVLVLLLVAAVAPEGTTSAHAATLFAGGLPLLLQCLPGFLLPLLCRCSSHTSDSKIQSDNKQRTGRRAVRQGNESAAGIGDYQPRAARSSAISGLASLVSSPALISMVYVPTKYQLADLLTKSTTAATFSRIMPMLTGYARFDHSRYTS